MLTVSVIVCGKNSADQLSKCLDGIESAGADEYIYVDGNSTDDSLKIAKEHNFKCYTDFGLGLTFARKVGLEQSKCQYVFYVGPDNILSKFSLGESLNFMLKNNLDFCTFRTKVLNPVSFSDKLIDKRFDFLFNERKINPIIGTPTLINKLVFMKLDYDSKMIGSDDTDLFEKSQKINGKWGTSEQVVFQSNNLTYKELKSKFYLYGIGDSNFYTKYSKNWNFKRKIKSINRVFLQTIRLMSQTKSVNPLFYLGYLHLMCVRYIGWISNMLKNIKS